MPKLSIAIPIVDSPQTAFFLSRLFQSISIQTFTDYEIVITKEGAMAYNHNAAILKSKGELIKLMQMDDYFAHKDALREIVNNFSETDQWMITACKHTLGTWVGNPHYPKWSDDMIRGDNTLGGVSTIVLRRDNVMLFDENLSWLVDCDLYKRYYDKYGLPKILNDINVVVDLRDTRLTHTLTDNIKLTEADYLFKKHDTGFL